MFAGRRVALIGAGATAVWYLLVVVFWALQPLTDAVPVGIDYTQSPPAAVSVTVDCQSLFASAPRGDSPLPTLKEQPKGSPPLGYQREPCVIVQQQARIVFAIDTAAFLVVMVGFVWLAVRRRRSASVDHVKADPGLSLSTH
jgi:hypothetical protein